LLLIPDIFVTAQTVLYHCTIASYHCTFCVSLHSILCPASLCLIKIILDLLMISRLLWVIFLLKKTLNAKQIFWGSLSSYDKTDACRLRLVATLKDKNGPRHMAKREMWSILFLSGSVFQ